MKKFGMVRKNLKSFKKNPALAGKSAFIIKINEF
jgi:hypothetical protein